MKAITVHCSQKAVEKAVKKETERQLEIEYDKIYRTVCYQTLAVVFDCLNLEFGFGEKRLKQLKDSVEESFVFMTNGVFGRTYNALDIVEKMKEKFDIDFEKSMYDEIGGIQK